jgi:hypothetical protein
MEYNLKLLKVEYLSNHLSNHTQILNLSLDDQTIFNKSLKVGCPWMEDDLKLLKWNISATTYWTILKFETYAYMTKPYFTNPLNEVKLKWK